MAKVHATACVGSTAQIADDAEIGPFCVIGPDVTIASGCRLVAHVHVSGHTSIGAGTVIHPFASLGTPPQSVNYRGGATRLVIGAGCDIREGVTMNIGTEDGGGTTEVGDRGFFMAHSHVAHDCRIGHDVIFANCATLGGHCTIGDYVFIGGMAAAHQFTRIGAHAMIGGATGLRGDVIPFGLTIGPTSRLDGINIVGMKRRKFSRQSIRTVQDAYRMLFLGEGVFASRVDAVEAAYGNDEAVAKIVAFLRETRDRPLCMAAAPRRD